MSSMNINFTSSPGIEFGAGNVAASKDFSAGNSSIFGDSQSTNSMQSRNFLQQIMPTILALIPIISLIANSQLAGQAAGLGTANYELNNTKMLGDGCLSSSGRVTNPGESSNFNTVTDTGKIANNGSSSNSGGSSYTGLSNNRTGNIPSNIANANIPATNYKPMQYNGTQIYVSPSGSDSNPGTKNAPVRSIQKASQLAQSGSTVHVAPGTYQGGIKTSKDGVNYVSDVKNGAKIVGNGGSGKGWSNSGDNVTINGFEVDGSNTSWDRGIHTTGNNSVIENCKVHDILQNPSDLARVTASGLGGAGIGASSAHNTKSNMYILNNVVYNIGQEGETSKVHGIYSTAPGTIANNVVSNTGGYNIHLWHGANNVNILNNAVYHGQRGGIGVGNGGPDSVLGGAYNLKVSGNKISDCPVGIKEAGDIGSNNIYSNNIFASTPKTYRLKKGTVVN